MTHEVLTLRNRIAEVPVLHERLGALLRAAGFSDETVHDLDLVAEEILVNTISYGYEGPGERTLEVRVWLEAGRATLEFRDDARPYDPLSQPEEAAPDGDRIGGWGIPLIRALTDLAEYRREGASNVLRIVKSERREPCP